MPIFQDDLEQKSCSDTPPSYASYMSRQYATDNVNQESYESVNRNEDTSVPFDLRATQSNKDIVDRAKLIERIKKGGSPRWTQMSRSEHTPCEAEAEVLQDASKNDGTGSHIDASDRTLREKSTHWSGNASSLAAGLEIQRPRSALHSGNFDTPQISQQNHHDTIDSSPLLNPVEPSWLATSPPRAFAAGLHDHGRHIKASQIALEHSARSRAASLSSSLSSLFAFRPPTSPLVHAQSNDEPSFDLDQDSIKNTATEASQIPSYQSGGISQSPSLFSRSVSSMKALPSSRRDIAGAYQAHQPRRSLNYSTPSSSFIESSTSLSEPRIRKASFTLDGSPLQLTSMVGSYEESILRGRMSTAPSKPLDFVAQIGVLGLGDCKPSLRCPPHVTLPFPAVFYSYNTTSHRRSSELEDGPSPYVGQIDLETGLPSLQEIEAKRRGARAVSDEGLSSFDLLDVQDERFSGHAKHSHSRLSKKKRRLDSPRYPPGGAYRIPEKGQLQIIIKNPNKTAVKLFLIPYDLVGMQAGTKTFIRQRSYSAGPIIDMAPSTQTVGVSSGKGTLRYLIHLHICCPSKGRYFLYKSVRVVFANRVPDGKEKLQNETQMPEPRFSRMTTTPASTASPALAFDKAYRRRSSGFQPSWSTHTSYPGFGSIDRISLFDGSPRASTTFDHGETGFGSRPVDAMPFSFNTRTATLGSPLQSSASDQSSRPATGHSNATDLRPTSLELGAQNKPWTNQQHSPQNDLVPGSGDFSLARTVVKARAAPKQMEGLLAMKFKGLEVDHGESG